MCSCIPCFHFTWQDFLPELLRCDKTPLTEAKARHYWRDSIMITGLVITITGVALSILQGAFLLSLALTAATCTIGFASYYVTRYADLKEMETQLSSLKSEVTTMRENNKSLQTTANTLTTRLQQSIKSLEETSLEFQRYRDAEPKLAEVVKQLQSQESALSELQIQNQSATKESHRLRQLLEQDTENLRKVRVELETTSKELSHITKELRDASSEATDLLRSKTTVQ